MPVIRMNPNRPGQFAVLNSGGPPLEVTEVRGQTAFVEYTDSKGVRREVDFPRACLWLLTPPTSVQGKVQVLDA